ncbi:glucosylceramidase [Reichenbachiella faecimaris]|uniref:Glucosylceramidase n=2 Tax=Reichenbachiella faecimaris TaxID=692418 RepID=A0A1W2GKM9_REIFA|nr:glucosylceramidase [Reichenbachiella faecimaris]
MINHWDWFPYTKEFIIMRNKIYAAILISAGLMSCQPEKKAETLEASLTEPAFTTAGKQMIVYTTASNSDLRLTQTETTTFAEGKQPIESEISIFVNPKKTYQKLMGIGGAITDASAETFDKLPADKQEELMAAYFDEKDGIGYSLTRTHIHSCDFSSGSYTYIEEDDTELKTFDISKDFEHRIPMIKRAIAQAGGELLLYVSPWSPPAFMKGKKDMLKGGKLLPEYRDAWATYYTKFIKAYEKEGMPIWGITIQNEPMATQTWESCIYTAQDERDFLRDHLGPIMKKEGLGDKKIVVWDHNRDLIANRANTIFGDPEAAKYAWGIGFHWYETWTGAEPNFNNLDNVQESYPTKNLLFTEGCNERFDQAKYQHWPHAERYGRSMINDFNQGTVGWTDWNILLDQTGGPNHVGNYCFAPIHADTNTGELIYTPSYYYIGHFSKFIKPDAARVSTASSRSQLLSTSFLNVDGTLATVVMNPGDDPISYNLFIDRQVVKLDIPAHAMQTLITK